MRQNEDEYRKYKDSSDNYEECTFSPEIAGGYPGAKRSTDDLFAWKETQERKLTARRIKETYEDITFKPRINMNSARMVKSFQLLG